jgi:hypothetical protein
MIEYTPKEVDEAWASDLESLKEEHDFVEADHQPGTFSYHEAFHTACIMMGQLDTPLLGHPAIILDKEAYKLAHEAHTAVFNLYQYLGSKHLTKE